MVAALSNIPRGSYAADSVADNHDMFHRLGKVSVMNNTVCQLLDKINK
jgi:hypothetical protein